jgi:predicted adenylyl cyclase CyaB
MLVLKSTIIYMSHFEIEVKSLLGKKENAEALKAKMHELDPECKHVSTNKQLNHYFKDGDVKELFKKVQHLFSGGQHDKFEMIAERGTDFSVRTRQRDEEILLVVKASIDEGTSENTVKRMEFEEPVSITLDELDALVLEAGYEYQAKWSREREEYEYKGANVCFDRNAGYGYLAEFEKIVQNESEADSVREEIDVLMKELEVVELSQERLARMFEHYNENWPDYYGTDKTFIIE